MGKLEKVQNIIQDIKELRFEFGSTLKETKDALEIDGTIETARKKLLELGYKSNKVDSAPVAVVDFTDKVNHPSHYNKGDIEVIEFIEDQGWGEGFCKGNAIKYIARAGAKDPDKDIEDMKKAIWYTRRAVEIATAKKEGRKPLRPNQMPKIQY